jgi:hypothetical protein
MIQRGEEVCVTLKPGNSVSIVDEAVRDHLEGDVTIESRITRSVHLAHPAGPDGGDDQRFAVIIWAGRQRERD